MPLKQVPLTAGWLASRLIERPRWHPPVTGRACDRHPATPAVDRCDRCGQPFCADCLLLVERWRICTACLARLRRERNGPTWPVLRERLRETRPSIVAVTIIVMVLGALVLLAARGPGSAAPAAIGGAEETVACLQQYPDRGRLYVPGGTSLSAPVPARLALRNCGFLPGERFEVEARIDDDVDSHGVRGLLVGTATGDVSAQSELQATLAIPDHARFSGYYDLHLHATGDRGSVAVRDIHGGEVACTPGKARCVPNRGTPVAEPD